MCAWLDALYTIHAEWAPFRMYLCSFSWKEIIMFYLLCAGLDFGKRINK